MNPAAALRSILTSMDVPAMERFHAEMMPHMPASGDVLASMHMARTQSEAMPDKARFYSHRWLEDRGLPSQLPDVLKPRAERMYPRPAYGVGISVKASSDLMRPITGEVQTAMERAVLEADADGKLLDTPHVKARMAEARAKTIRSLMGVR